MANHYTGAGSTTRSIAAAVLLVLAWILSGCSSPDSAAPASQAYPIETPTLSSLDQTQQAIDERMAQELQTAAARPTPETLPPLPTDLPTIPHPTGILTDCERIYFRRTLIYKNCWQNQIDNDYFYFVAGYDPDNPDQGKIGFYTVTPGDYEPDEVFDFPTPTEHGAVTIIAANPPRFTLEAADGTQFVFNVETRQWEESPYPGP